MIDINRLIDDYMFFIKSLFISQSWDLGDAIPRSSGTNWFAV